MKIAIPLIVGLSLAALSHAQTITEAPSPKPKTLIAANAAMWGSSLLLGFATKYGSEQCRKESIKEGRPQLFGRASWIGGQLHPYRHSFKTTLPLNMAVTTMSMMWNRKQRSVWLPLLVTGVQSGIAGNQFAGGCY